MLVLAATHINGLNVSVFQISTQSCRRHWEENALKSEFVDALKKVEPHHLASSRGVFIVASRLRNCTTSKFMLRLSFEVASRYSDNTKLLPPVFPERQGLRRCRR